MSDADLRALERAAPHDPLAAERFHAILLRVGRAGTLAPAIALGLVEAARAARISIRPTPLLEVVIFLERSRTLCVPARWLEPSS